MTVKRRPKPEPPPVETCGCLNYDAIHCLAERHEIALTLSACLNGCNCPCHRELRMDNWTPILLYWIQPQKPRVK